VKGDNLYLARSSQGVLSTAWVPEMKVFLWNSVGSNLTRVLKRNGLKPKEFHVRELPANKITRINMTKFAAGQPAQKTIEAARAWGSRAISRAQAERYTGSTTATAWRHEDRPTDDWRAHQSKPLVSLRDLQERIETLEQQVETLLRIQQQQLLVPSSQHELTLDEDR
jgi:hypothetical protein